MKIGFIGAGNMAQAIIKGLQQDPTFATADFIVTASSPERSQQVAASLKVRGAKNNHELARQADLIFLTVKPHLLATVLSEIETTILEKQPVLISIAAGVSLATLAQGLPQVTEPQIFRAMPNLNVTIGQGVTALCGNDWTTQSQHEQVTAMLSAVGSVYPIAEKDFRNFTALAGCSPAFTALYIDAMSRAAVKNGLPKALATKIAAEAVLGTAALLSQQEEETPWDLIDKVCSPGGTTVAGLVSLEEEAFAATVIHALDATIARDLELGNEH